MDRVLLPSDVLPEHYDLTLEPDVEKFVFDGSVKITCDVKVATDSISLHAHELVLWQASFTPSEGSACKAETISLKIKSKSAELGFGEVLPVGNGILEIKFRGTLNDQLAGFYRSQYTDANGVKRFMATTQFEAIDARRCFPCWDEPARKATFGVTMIYPAFLSAVSNMPPCSLEICADGRKKETFMSTPKMSTYLLAFCVGELEFISARTKSGVLARIYACPGNSKRCSFALKCCVRALEFYDEFFGLPYPLPKMDMIAIPDFAIGAMENWGLVTYREVCLLCEEATVSALQKQRICSIIAHELAHQWFGNLVTMEWWEDLWLNEGFANWMETFTSDHLFPEWGVWEAYVGDDQQRALRLDALRSSHPIQVPIKRAEEVEEVFDAISYSKGGSVVRMIYSVLGEKDFQRGLQLYFERHKYGNTRTTDLWKAWKEVSGKPVDEMMSSWTKQMGFPLLEVLSDPFAGGPLELKQSWFLADGSREAEDENSVWFCPILVGTDQQLAPVSFLEQKVGKVECNLDGAKLLKVNYGQHVPLRVLYPESLFRRLVQNLGCLSAEDRIGLLADTFAICKAGAQDPSFLVDLLGGFKGELNENVFEQLVSCLGSLEKIICGLDEDIAKAFKAFCASLVKPAFQAVGWEPDASESENRKKLRTAVLGAVASYCAEGSVAAEAVARCRAFVAEPTNPEVLNADVRLAVLSVAVQSEAAIFDALLQAHDVVTDGAARVHIYRALGSVSSAQQRQRALEFNLTKVRSQDLIYIPMVMAGSGTAGAEAAFAWIQKEYDQIYEKIGAVGMHQPKAAFIRFFLFFFFFSLFFGGGGCKPWLEPRFQPLGLVFVAQGTRVLSMFPSGTASMMMFQNMVRICGGFVTEEKAQEVETFWRSKPVYENVQKCVAQTVEGILSNAKFVARLKPSKAGQASTWRSMVDSRL